MQYYFLTAKKVGSLTGVFLAQLDEQFAKANRGFFSGFRLKGRKIGEFPVVNGKLSVPGEGFFAADIVQARWREHLRGERDSTQAIWSVLMFQAWKQQTAA